MKRKYIVTVTNMSQVLVEAESKQEAWVKVDKLLGTVEMTAEIAEGEAGWEVTDAEEFD
jgi:hypothetical protein